MTDVDGPWDRYPLSNGVHYFLAGDLTQWAKDLGVHTTEMGPFATKAEAMDAVVMYDLAIRLDLHPREYAGMTIYLLTIEVGEALAPTPGQLTMVARTSYLAKPVAGGFANMDEAMWIYNTVMDYVEARLAYLEEEMCVTLNVDVDEDYVFESDATVWLRTISAEVVDGLPSNPLVSTRGYTPHLSRHDSGPGSARSLWYLWQLVPAARELDEADPGAREDFRTRAARWLATGHDAGRADGVPDLTSPLGPLSVNRQNDPPRA